MQAGKTGGCKDLHQFSKRSRIKKNPNKTLRMNNNNKKPKTNETTSEVFPGATMADEDGARWFRVMTHDVAKVGYLLVVLRFFFVCNNFMSHKLVIRRMSSPCPLHHFCVIRMFFLFCQNSEAASYNKVSVKQGCYY